jgi:hypothetical protein
MDIINGKINGKRIKWKSCIKNKLIIIILSIVVRNINGISINNEIIN